MENRYFVTDMALDGVSEGAYGGLDRVKRLNYGVIRHSVHVKDKELSRSLNREMGVYFTLDASGCNTGEERQRRYLSGLISALLVQLVGAGGQGTVLVVGLGNEGILSDSLGARTVASVKATRGSYAASSGRALCTLSAGVSGVTGIKSVELVTSVCKEIKPTAVILVDTLATSSAHRLGASYQITSAGLAPGSGVNRDKPRIDRGLLGVPTVAVGVPLILNEGTVLKSFLKKYLEETGQDADEFVFRRLLADARLADLSVAPKETEFLVKNAAAVISEAVNTAFGER